MTIKLNHDKRVYIARLINDSRRKKAVRDTYGAFVKQGLVEPHPNKFIGGYVASKTLRNALIKFGINLKSEITENTIPEEIEVNEKR